MEQRFGLFYVTPDLSKNKFPVQMAVKAIIMYRLWITYKKLMTASW